MYTVFGFPRTRTMRVIWMLEELGVAYELVPSMPQSAEIREMSPLGKVPLLQDGSVVLRDSVAICQYLADKHGKLTHPAGTLERARQDGFTQFVIDEIDGALWTAAKNTFANPPDRRAPEVKRVCMAEFAIALDRLAQMLDGQPYLMGHTFTLPDLLVGHCAGWAEAARFPLPDSGPVADYIARTRARPAFAAAAKRAQEAAPA
ncbi:glutathione S-transferase family protein [Stappia sp.]|jgi:glutathione S-transferase|uniref:glutathione S-transferase family protein n=1 Tax=Stappia sp. TaxID=1870903 RepID=UPI003A9A0D59